MSTFCRIGGFLLLSTSLALSLLAVISAPAISGADVTRTTFSGTVNVSNEAVDQLRLGLWGHCQRRASDQKMICERSGPGYTLKIQDNNGRVEYIKGRWVAGLPSAQIPATISLFAALLVAFFIRGAEFIAVLLVLATNAAPLSVDVAFLLYQRSKMNNFGIPESTVMGNGFWFDLAAFLILPIALVAFIFGSGGISRSSTGRSDA